MTNSDPNQTKLNFIRTLLKSRNLNHSDDNNHTSDTVQYPIKITLSTTFFLLVRFPVLAATRRPIHSRGKLFTSTHYAAKDSRAGEATAAEKSKNNVRFLVRGHVCVRDRNRVHDRVHVLGVSISVSLTVSVTVFVYPYLCLCTCPCQYNCFLWQCSWQCSWQCQCPCLRPCPCPWLSPCQCPWLFSSRVRVWIHSRDSVCGRVCVNVHVSQCWRGRGCSRVCVRICVCVRVNIHVSICVIVSVAVLVGFLMCLCPCLCPCLCQFP